MFSRFVLFCMAGLLGVSIVRGEDAKTDRPEKTTQFKIENNHLILPGPIVFESGKDVIKEESEKNLWVVVDFLEAKTFISKLRIEGHTDSDGNADENQALSEKRALAVAKWLVKHSVDCKRVLPVGFGQTKPVAANDSPENKAANRRIDFVIAELRGKPIAGMPVDGGGQPAGNPCE